MKNNLLIHRRWRATLAPSLLALFACAAPGLSRADADDALNFSVESSATHDNNLFRLSSGNAPARAESSRSDTIYKFQGGVHLDKPYAQQRLQADLTATQYTYQNNRYLNASAVDYRGAWLWAVTPQLTGVLSADQVSSPMSYTDLQSISNKNLQKNTSRRLTADWAIDGVWHAVGGVQHLRSATDSGVLTATGNYEQNSAEGGIKYVSAANNSLAAMRRQVRGDYLGRSLSYEQSDSELVGVWQLTGRSRLDAKLGYTDRTHNLAQRNYAGTTGMLSYQLTPAGKLRFTLATGRDLVPYLEANNSYYVSNFIALTPAWLVSEKTTISLRLGFNQNDFRGPLTSVALMREDKVRSAQLSAAWRPASTISVDGYLSREQRSSNISTLDYNDNIIGINGSFRF
jgi:exopolysaccharide biosynthesis operon protein EpsL